MTISATTNLNAFFGSLKNRLAHLLHENDATARNNIFVVDALRFQNTAVPALQIEPVSLVSIGEQSAMNVMVLEYRVHAIVKVEQDFGKSSDQAMLGLGPTSSGAVARGAFTLATAVADRLIGYKVNDASEVQVFMRLERGENNDVEGLTSASAYFRTMIRLFADG